MIERIVKMTFKAGTSDEFLDIFNSSEQFIGSFDGCMGVKLMKELNCSDSYFTISTWKSEDHLNVYRDSELFRTTWAKVKPLFSEKAVAWSLTEYSIRSK